MGESNVVKKQAAVVDIFKFLFSICILALHTNIVHNFPVKLQWYITHLIFRLGVPFFFCTSDIFLGANYGVTLTVMMYLKNILER